MIQFLLDRAERAPGAPACIAAGLTVSYGALLREMQNAAAWLYRCGVRAGDTVALELEAEPARSERTLSLVYALFYLGAPLLPLYPDTPPAVRGPLATRFNARWLVAGSAASAPVGCTRLDPASLDREFHDDGWRARPAPRGDEPARPLCYEFTSGTTGTPKAVLLTDAQYTAVVRNNLRYLGWQDDDRLLPVAPFPGKVGLRSMLRIHAAGGALVNVPYPETGHQLADIVDEFGVTALRAVPWRVRELLASGQPAGGRLRPLRFVDMAGALVAPEDIRAARVTLSANVHVHYACSEGGIIAHLPPTDAFDAAPRLIAGMEGRAVDDAGHPLSAGAVGRLCFRAAWLPTAYVANERATAEQFVAGWFYPGDYGSIDVAGRVTVRGRSDGAINHGGSKILPRDIEAVLEQHPDVAEAAVIGVSHPVKGEVPVAFVVPQRGLSARVLSEYCDGRLEGWRLPALILTVASIPRNAAGKVVQSELRGIYDEWAKLYLAAGPDRG